MSEERGAYDIEQARAAIDTDRQQRAAECRAAIQSICAQLRCNVVGVPVITADGRIAVEIQVVAQ